jgi:hypothetical protein
MAAVLIHVLVILFAVTAHMVNWLTYRRTRAAALQVQNLDQREQLLQAPYRRFVSVLIIFGGLSVLLVVQQLSRLRSGADMDGIDALSLLLLLLAMRALLWLSRRDQRTLLNGAHESEPASRAGG